MAEEKSIAEILGLTEEETNTLAEKAEQLINGVGNTNDLLIVFGKYAAQCDGRVGFALGTYCQHVIETASRQE